MNFKTVTANITWDDKSQETETAIISNTSEYRYLESCDFCGTCKNCKHDEQIFYYTDSLAEIDALLNKPHHDGWMIKSYSVTN